MLSVKRLGLFWLLCWLPLFAHAQWFSSSSNDQFLPVMEAFQPTAWHDGETLYIGIQSAEGYYLYRHQFDVKSQTPSVALGSPALPEGTFTNDEFMGDVYTFRDILVFEHRLNMFIQVPSTLSLPFKAAPMPGFATHLNRYHYRPLSHSRLLNMPNG